MRAPPSSLQGAWEDDLSAILSAAAPVAGAGVGVGVGGGGRAAPSPPPSELLAGFGGGGGGLSGGGGEESGARDGRRRSGEMVICVLICTEAVSVEMGFGVAWYVRGVLMSQWIFYAYRSF